MNFFESLLQPVDFQSLIDEAVTINSETKTAKRDASKFHMSDAGKCYRARFYKRLGVEPTRKIPVEGLRKMLAGDAGHLHLQWLLNRYGKLFASEGEIATDHVKGHFDGIIKHNNVKTLLEIKTVEKWSMSHIVKDGAKPEHELQLFSYWTYLRHDYTNLDTACLAYVKREDFSSKTFYYEWSQEIADMVNREWQPLVAAWEMQELPECTCPLMYDGNGAKYCAYATSDKDCCDPLLIKEHK